MSAVKMVLDISPVLFLNTKGEPMRFFVRPGPTKVQLQPLIVNGGGVLCRTQEPNTILLADSADISAAIDGAGQFYFSTQYIRDCVAQKQQLDLENYRFSNLQPIQTRAASRKQRGSGRMGYSLEDDAAILDFIGKRQHEVKGNRVWQQMEQQGITAHSWQSMKDRFLKHLTHKLVEKSAEKKRKVLPLKESSSSEENTPKASPQNKKAKKALAASFSDSDATHISPDVQCLPEDSPTDLSEPQTSPEKIISPQCPPENNKPQAKADDSEKQPHDCEAVQGSSHEEQLQQCPQDGEQPEVSSKRGREDKDVPGETSDGHNGLTIPTVIRQESCKKSTNRGRKLGILERAAREFEDSQMVDSESLEDRPQSRASSDLSDSDEHQIMAARERAIREQEESAEHCNSKQNAPEPQSNRCTHESADDAPGPSNANISVTSNVHMFIFDQESQEDLTQSSQKEPLSQELKQAKEHVINLMQESKKDLIDVMKALLKASGDLKLARSYLLEGYDPQVHGPIWTRRDDDVLLSDDSSKLENLHEMFGADRVLKREAFLKGQ